jgi:hypothetical protein
VPHESVEGLGLLRPPTPPSTHFFIYFSFYSFIFVISYVTNQLFVEKQSTQEHPSMPQELAEGLGALRPPTPPSTCFFIYFCISYVTNWLFVEKRLTQEHLSVLQELVEGLGLLQLRMSEKAQSKFFVYLLKLLTVIFCRKTSVQRLNADAAAGTDITYKNKTRCVFFCPNNIHWLK